MLFIQLTYTDVLGNKCKCVGHLCSGYNRCSSNSRRTVVWREDAEKSRLQHNGINTVDGQCRLSEREELYKE